VDEALARGHRVTAVSRDPARIERRHPRLDIARGDILDPASVGALVIGRDAVVVSVRGIAGDSSDPADAITRLGVENVVEALRRSQAPRARLIHVGGAGTLEVEPGVLLADRLPNFLLPESFELEVAGQLLTLEYLRGIDDVDWSCITPPRSLTWGKRRGEYRVGGDRLLENERGASSISRADFAAALLDEVEQPAHQRRRFTVAY
jgi:putative NADH-flavin reductase